MGFIYTLTSPSIKKYIGQTTRPIEKRFKEHQEKDSECSAISRSIQKYGWDNFIVDYYECPDDELNKHEKWMIKLMNSLSPNGYNLREGGGSHGRMSEESKQKMSISKSGKNNPNFGKPKSQSTKEKLSIAMSGKNHPNYGKNHTIETRKKMSETQIGERNHNFGKKASQTTKEKISIAVSGEKNGFFGKNHTPESRTKMSESHKGKNLGDKHSNSKRVYKYDLNGNYITSFGSCGEAGRDCGKKQGNLISQCANINNKKIDTAYGFKWSYIKI
ncbi:hypothetical protein NY2A_B433L [Paramecium bursaria Chlorella virus NY2A]|uniref:Uncharacterized protein B433L n=1 Tax=Paramecium bursaria Chlorella virus NY2A TaxID=46021 RepID=A7IWV8_PBCVN|nr:hypothetical protein NY2A_B433L [Paramecium bursaria Chlorella virus NY2A]ABT14832.1 hypothetical protein NY2A_B433L [Paramecium bursaria Chlorella virus NY2A]